VVHNAGGVFMCTIFAVLILLPTSASRTGHLASYHPLRTEMPAFSLFNLNVLGKMCVGAFAGFEYMAILAGETHSPASAVKKSVYYAAPLITRSSSSHRDGGGLHPRTRSTSSGRCRRCCAPASALRHRRHPRHDRDRDDAGDARVPDQRRIYGGDSAPDGRGLGPPAPAWFSRLHATHRTPVNSILVVAVFSFAMSVLSLVGVGRPRRSN